LRLACTTRALRSLDARLERELTADCGTVFIGSGDFHHVTSSLVTRHGRHAPLDVFVFDNHPDNMRHVGGVHCGSWVRRVALLPFVGHVQVIGITSADVSAPQAWANYLLPLWRRKLSYWCIGVETAWGAASGPRARGDWIRFAGRDAGSILRSAAALAPRGVRVDRQGRAPSRRGAHESGTRARCARPT
jgi:hypothetical protein